ncbi:MAG: Stage 0 sporulation A-like protein [Eubacteriales bacterium]
MYDVILVDDESVIVEGLKKVVNWKKYGCRVVATADDATTGAQKIRKFKPDILFTDIRMAHIDGLTMLAGVKSEFPNMQIAVLTGYRDFEYAQKAIQLGVTRFLLKPSQMDEINETLEVMTARLDQLYSDSVVKMDFSPAESDGESGNMVVSAALRYMKEHYTEKIKLTDVADKAYVSQWHLSKLLNKYTHQSFNDLLNQMRIEKAKELLCDPSLKVHEIGDYLAFNDVTHFSKTFKKFVHCTPLEYRNSGCGNRSPA